MVIQKDHPALQSDPKDVLKDEFDNARILLYEIDQAILYLTKNKYSKYTIDSGQTTWTVQYADLGALYDRRAALIEELSQLENAKVERSVAFVARPV